MITATLRAVYIFAYTLSTFSRYPYFRMTFWHTLDPCSHNEDMRTFSAAWLRGADKTRFHVRASVRFQFSLTHFTDESKCRPGRGRLILRYHAVQLQLMHLTCTKAAGRIGNPSHAAPVGLPTHPASSEALTELRLGSSGVVVVDRAVSFHINLNLNNWVKFTQALDNDNLAHPTFEIRFM